MAPLPCLAGRGGALEIVDRATADERLDAEVEAIACRLARFDAIARTKSYPVAPSPSHRHVARSARTVGSPRSPL
jgi:hypothetical protein